MHVHNTSTWSFHFLVRSCRQHHGRTRSSPRSVPNREASTRNPPGTYKALSTHLSIPFCTVSSIMRLGLLALTFSAIHAALAAPQSSSGTISCDEGGSVQCCETLGPAGEIAISLVLEALGISVKNLTTPVGTGCSPDPYDVGTGGGSTCISDPVCCVDNYFGSVGVGCEPVPSPVIY